MENIRPAAVSGQFYPSDPGVLQQQIAGFINKARPAPGCPVPKTLILPHAGYRFSGAVACQGISLLPKDTQNITRVVILSPAHTMQVQGIVAPVCDGFETPLGCVPVDTSCLKQLAEKKIITLSDAPHVKEHGIEVLLPFLQSRLKSFAIVPFVVGKMPPAEVEKILDHLWGDVETLIIISSDLSHYMAAKAAEKTDLNTAQKIELLNGDLNTAEACGAYALSGFLHTAHERGMRLTRQDLTHSGQTVGNPDRVVGYGCWAASDPLNARLSDQDRLTLLRVAARALNIQARMGKAPSIKPDTLAQPIYGMGAAFITLEQNKRLRGCIGSLRAHQPLVEDVMQNTVKAGFQDPRFKPVTLAELPTLDIEIAYLSAPALLTFESEQDVLSQLVPERDGLIFQDGSKRSTFLPKVWDALNTPEKFLNALKVKAGLRNNHWSDTVKIWRYTTERFGAPFKTLIS